MGNEEDEGAISSKDNQTIAQAMASRYAKSQSGSGSGGSAASTAGSAMMMSGEPTTMAAGATLKVISGVAERRRKEREAAADRENARRSKLMVAMSNLGAGVGSTGMA